MPKPHGASNSAAVSQPAPTRGPALTEKLIAANADLTREEKEFNANAEKIKGNEFFRCVCFQISPYAITLGTCFSDVCFFLKLYLCYINIFLIFVLQVQRVCSSC